MGVDTASKDKLLCGNLLSSSTSKDDLSCGKLVGSSTWHLVENPLSMFGNNVEKLGCNSPFPWDSSTDAPPNAGVRPLFSGSEGGRPIDIKEFEAASQLLQTAHDDSFWEVLLSSPKTGFLFKRLASEPNNGPITILARIKLRGLPLEAVAHVMNNFTDRSKWDKQQVNFRCHDDWGSPVRCNSLFYFILRVPPLTDREFLNIFAMARSDDGNAYMTIARDGTHPSYKTRKGCVRGSLFGNVLLVSRGDEPGSTNLTMITKQDVKLPVVPHWLINKVVPGQISNWNDKMQRACRAVVLRSQTLGQLPLASFFAPFSPGFNVAIQGPDRSRPDCSKLDCSKQDCLKQDFSLQDCSEHNYSKQDSLRWAPADISSSENPQPNSVQQLAGSTESAWSAGVDSGDIYELDAKESSTHCCQSWFSRCAG